MTVLQNLSIAKLQEGYKNKDFSVREVVDFFIERIEKHDNKINSFTTTTFDQARKLANMADEKIAKDGPDIIAGNPLLGIPLAYKDIYSTKGVKTTASARVLENYVPSFSSTVVSRLEDAEAISLGKLNCDAWAHGSSGENSDFGPTKNPWNLEYVPGGSSSGSAAAVASEFIIAATASDTGGSIRLPSSFCGVSGIKPTYGRVSRYGVVAMASSLDSMGLIASSVEDLARILEITAGKDFKDATSWDIEVASYSKELNEQVKELRIGIPAEYFGKGLSGVVKEKVDDAIKKFEEQGAQIQEVSLPHSEYAIPAYYIIMASEVSSNLARYDGIRFGNGRDAFGEETKRRIMLGTFSLSSGYKDEYYNKAQEVRRLITKDFTDAFEKVDMLIAPVSPTPPFKLREKTEDPLQMYLSDILTVSVNLAGVPALSLPCGFTQDELPIGLQLIGPKFSELKLFRAGYEYQQLTDWHKRKPQL
ncbi:MAG: glutaminyl-tRNA synthase (glutamine-hydrolyzing) subunit A [Candidatus Blackburnbacteria bacterium RIFCSPHIGHO2_02_FULL_39_13]|uniref:Glutamyl-tRNA(Gln) amidotransferase subunit A n=1 Tax=Candidatus Blackburnbacteria bacterium RIFCSPLOWO2_01_FULL_40_20 TaxID=1797519 RepID=A0A1G1VCV4_9BACT|nr:MAG: Glutamyl-tRNA(Gln) amidotransferase subunit A [Microgenomates group bacterium GW2011_GWA2_39_19]OGY06963.1 MAG: glutaminyl-tRNA synthase (glutamine-hydrolyzing) subunit A [Candidatus Blackburnbacteria bacterium RIFCSPHIGHO2_01_FULL_40_17]OGY09630.1 MAG: glutaminyl-tRNA synthase (glutamine-hydrolyzing) subunit A [Candidatus Blackburnbacteria bacterium RIFCSPHIGHO2_02_FULL_39_13]OGY13219.1 MAG: glutaminyl-tRNA synthase (glutamine-hydrolyzing) subunit A [Candidatus Blackburnbacteria bacteri